ncbi:hypothetical protein [Microbacterium sp. 2MCAF23]|uniref:hypothetical protein n=1 Tax=Microbacterium sp. 2MCAF23 TaxID=3232985 RepID=UPI003F9749EC
MTDPTTPSGEPLLPILELAPPLGPPAPPAGALPVMPRNTPAAAAPPYAAAAPAPAYVPAAPAPQTPPVQPPYATPPSYSAGQTSAYPAAQSPIPAPRGRFPLALVISGAVVLLLLIAVSIGALLLITRGAGSVAAPPPSGQPLSSSAPSAPPGTTPDTHASAAPSGGPGSPHVAADVEAMLAEMLAQYKQSSQDGSLWQRIPDDEHNRVALQAFLYILTDMHSAFLWGVDEPTAQKFKTDAEEAERKLLAQEPLGTDVKITGKNGTFTYNGDTGEGGWT